MRHERPRHRHPPNQERVRVTTTRIEVATSAGGNEKLFFVSYPGQRTRGYVVETYAAGQFQAECAFGVYADDVAAKAAFLGGAESTQAPANDVAEPEVPHAPAFLQVSAATPAPPEKPKPVPATSPRKLKPHRPTTEAHSGAGRKGLADMARGLTTR